MANYAGGVVVMKRGTATVSAGNELLHAIEQTPPATRSHCAQSKILSRNELRQKVERWRRSGESMTLANGNFDLLHVGHMRYLGAPKLSVASCVVAVNSDASVRALKGEGRPLMPEHERAEIVAALAAVDAVVIFPELDVRAIIREIRPEFMPKEPTTPLIRSQNEIRSPSTVDASPSWETPKITPPAK